MKTYDYKTIILETKNSRRTSIKLWLSVPDNLKDSYHEIKTQKWTVWVNKILINVFSLVCEVFDYAIPQSVFEEMFKDGGSEAVNGVWCYDKELGFGFFGGFFHYDRALELAKARIAKAYEEAEDERE